jgi:hypothetical protein
MEREMIEYENGANVGDWSAVRDSGKPQETVGVYELLVLNAKHEKMIELLEARVSMLETMLNVRDAY